MKKVLLLAVAAFAVTACSSSDEGSSNYPSSMNGSVWESKTLSKGNMSTKYKMIFSQNNVEFRFRFWDNSGAFTLVSSSKPVYTYNSNSGNGKITGMVDLGNGRILFDDGTESTVFTQNGITYIVTPNGNNPLGINIPAENIDDSFVVKGNELKIDTDVLYRQ